MKRRYEADWKRLGTACAAAGFLFLLLRWTYGFIRGTAAASEYEAYHRMASYPESWRKNFEN